MAQNADFFEQKAIDVQEAAAEDDRDLALKSVDCQLYLFWGASLLDIAVKSESHRFVETESCTQAIEYRLYGDLSPYDTSETFFGWLKLVMAVGSFGLLPAVSGWLDFTPPPTSEGFRRIAQRRRIPKGYPNAPSDNPILKRLKGLVGEGEQKFHINISYRGVIFVDKKLRKLLNLKDSKTSELSETEIAILWSPTFGFGERLKCFLMAPNVLFFINGLITICITTWFSVWFTFVRMQEHDGSDYLSSRTQITYHEWIFFGYFTCSLAREVAQLFMSIMQLGQLAGFIDYAWSLWNITDIFSGLFFL